MLSRFQRLIYGLARFGSSTLLGVFNLSSVYIYWSYYGLNPVLTGWVNAVGKIVIAFSGYIVGYLSDITSTRLGKRKPYIIAGAMLLALSFTLYYIPPREVITCGQTAVFIYALFFNSLFNFSYALLITPYQAWMPEITEPGERVYVSALQNIANLLAGAVSVAVSFIMPSILKIEENIFTFIILFLSILEILLYIPTILAIPAEKVTVFSQSLLKNMSEIIGNWEYVKWILCQGAISISTTITLSTVLSFTSMVLELGRGYKEVAIGGLVFIVAVIFFILWGKSSEIIGRRRTMLISNIIFSVSLASTVALAFLGEDIRRYIGYIFLAGTVIGASGFHLFSYAIIADIAHVDQLKSGLNRAGLYTGFNNIVLNSFQTVGYVLAGYILSLPRAPYGDYTYGLLLWGPIAALFVVLGSLILARTNVEPFRGAARGSQYMGHTSGSNTVSGS